MPHGIAVFININIDTINNNIDTKTIKTIRSKSKIKRLEPCTKSAKSEQRKHWKHITIVFKFNNKHIESIKNGSKWTIRKQSSINNEFKNNTENTKTMQTKRSSQNKRQYNHINNAFKVNSEGTTTIQTMHWSQHWRQQNLTNNAFKVNIEDTTTTETVRSKTKRRH